MARGFSSYDGWDCLTSEDLKDLRNYQKDLLGKAGYIRFDTRALLNVQTKTLKSYYTDVCTVRDGKLVRLWDGWSSTTAKHVDMFCDYYKLPRVCKKDWLAMPIGA